jgi:NAD(P)-dependent dehydrogenase (short-subunit alcohol dehydrogenase family)
LQALVQEIRDIGGQAIPVALDVADGESVANAFDAVETAFGTVDTVVANAGAAVVAPALSYDLDDFDRTLRVNLRGAFLQAREGARRIVDAKVTSGRILFIASIGGHTVLPGLAAYSASKAGLIMLGRSLAAEWARYGISVNTICPGYMLTEMNNAWFSSEGGQRQIARFRNERLMPLDALDPAVLYLTSNAALHTTGAVITIDDAQSL